MPRFTAIVVAPWARAGAVAHVQLDHTSVFAPHRVEMGARATYGARRDREQSRERPRLHDDAYACPRILRFGGNFRRALRVVGGSRGGARQGELGSLGALAATFGWSTGEATEASVASLLTRITGAAP